MTLSRTQTLVPAVLFALSAFAPACKCKSGDTNATTAASASASASASPSVAALSPEMQKKVDALAASVDQSSWSFKAQPPAAEAIELSVAVAKAHMGEAASGAAYQTLARTLKPETKLNEDVIDVLVEGLRSPTPRLAARALAAAAPSLVNGRIDERLLKAIDQLALQDAFREGKGRYALLEALSVASVGMRRGHFEDVLLASLRAPEPYVLITAMQLLEDDKPPFKRDPKLEAAFLSLTEHADPAVRGVALRSYGQVSAAKSEQARNVLIPALKHESPFVRAQACMGLSVVGGDEVVPYLVPLLDDLADDRQQYYASSFERDAILKAINSTYWPHVADASQYAFQRIASKAPRVDLPKPKDVSGSLKKTGKELKAWYAKNKASFPQPPPAGASQQLSGAPSTGKTTQTAGAKAPGSKSGAP